MEADEKRSIIYRILPCTRHFTLFTKSSQQPREESIIILILDLKKKKKTEASQSLLICSRSPLLSG